MQHIIRLRTIAMVLIVGLVCLGKGAEGQVLPVFLGEEQFTPPWVYCVHEDFVNNSMVISDCDLPGRSSGCDIDNYRCQIQFIVEGNTDPILNFSSLLTYSEFYPGKEDGKIIFTAEFTSNVTFVEPHGFYQLWKLDEGSSNVYRFTKRREYVDVLQNIPPASQVAFHGLDAGMYRIIYWDIGGTRSGLGRPEISDEIEVRTLCARDFNVRPKIIPNDATFYTRIKVNRYQFLGYELTGDAGFETCLLNADSSQHNRQIVWEHRSDHGNMINVQSDRIPDPIIITGASKPFYTRVLVAMCGIRGCHRTSIQVRLIYKGQSIDTYTKVWQNRQRYGWGILIGARPIELVHISGDTPRGCGSSCAEQFELKNLNFIEEFDDYDRFTYHTTNRSSFVQNSDSITSSSNAPFLGSGESLVFDDFYTDNEFQSTNVEEGFMFRYQAYFHERANSGPESASDYACSIKNHQNTPVRGAQFGCSPNGPAGFTNKRGTVQVADVIWDKGYAQTSFFGCTYPSSPLSVCDYAPNTNCDCTRFLSGGFGCQNVCNDLPKDFIIYYGASTLRPHRFERETIAEGIPNLGGGCNLCEATGSSIGGCHRGFTVGWREEKLFIAEACDAFVFSVPNRGMEQWSEADYAVKSSFVTSNLDSVECIAQRAAFLSAARRTPVMHYRSGAPPVFTTPNGFSFGETGDNSRWYMGADMFMVSANTIMGPNNNVWKDRSGNVRFYISSLAVTYSRFKIFPEIEVYYFDNYNVHSLADPNDDTIEVRFRISCPSLNLGWTGWRGFAYSYGWCIDTWRVRNQNNQIILVDVIEGGLRQISNPSYGAVDDLQEVDQEMIFTLRVKYKDGDRLKWYFYPRQEPERQIGTSFCTLESSFYETPFPPREHIYKDLICSAKTAPPACPYNQPEIITVCFRGDPFAYESIRVLDLPSVLTLGNDQIQPRFIDYYEIWNFNGTIVQGFAEEFQLFEYGAKVTIYDRRTAVVLNNIALSLQPPLYLNPLARPPRCIPEPGQIGNATCPITIEDPDIYSGIDQFHICEVDEPSVLLAPRFVLESPFTINGNIGAWFFNETTEFIDVFIDEIRYKGIFQKDTQFLVNRTSFNTLTVRYGKTIDGLLDTPCFERLIDFVIVLTPFLPDPSRIMRDESCVRTDDCCYFVNVNVFGNTPETVDIVNLDSCSGDYDACKYEILVSPPAVDVAGHLCLGQTYTFTVQSPASLLSSRPGPDFQPILPIPWRCPASFTFSLPTSGFSPLTTTVLPGPCTDPGAVVEFSIRYTEPGCDGNMASDNLDPNCQVELVFAIQDADTLDFVPGATTSAGYVIQGAFALPYNAETRFIYPDFFNSTSAGSLADGEWNAFFWLRPVGSGYGFSHPEVDARNMVSTVFLAFQENAENINVIRRQIVRPTCPAKSTDGVVESAIQVGFNVLDLTFNGDYTIEFLSPQGNPQGVSYKGTPCSGNKCIIKAIEFCAFPICPLVDIDPVGGCDACDLEIRDKGIPITGLIGTGVYSNSESGFYRLRVSSSSSECVSSFFERIDALNSLNVEINCFNSLCPDGRTGVVESSVTGGTVRPVFDRPLVQGPYNEVYKTLYTYHMVTPEGNTSVPFLARMPIGEYQLFVSDANNCTDSASCTIGSTSTRMVFELVNATAPKCSDGPGQLDFAIVNGTKPYTLLKIGPEQQKMTETSSVTLTDSTVVPGELYTYVIVDKYECRSPVISFQIDPDVVLSIMLAITRRPCAANQQNGGLIAVVPPGSGGFNTFTWFKDGIQIAGDTSTLDSIFPGNYRVFVENIGNCTASATINLLTIPPFNIEFIRTDATVDPGTIVATITGGNGPPYTVEVVPQDGITVVPVEKNSMFESYRLDFVPAQWSGFIRVQDDNLCIGEEFIEGARIPIDIEFTEPTAIASPEAEPRDRMNVGIYYVIIGYCTFAIAMIFLSFGYFEYSKRKDD